MAATRIRFKPAEREQFVKDAQVEWLNGSHWRPGVIATGKIETDSIGYQYLEVRDTGQSTRTFTGGSVIWGYAKHIRLRKSCSCGEAWADEPGHDNETSQPGKGGGR